MLKTGMHQNCCIVLLLISFFAGAQNDPGTGKQKLRAYGLSVKQGSVFIHKPDVQNVENSRPWSIAAEYSVQMTDTAVYNLCRAFPRKGWALTYTDFGIPILGKGVYASHFFQPTYRIGNRLQFQFRGEAGIGYFSAPYDADKNPGNNNYSLHITPYIHLGAGFGGRISNHLTAELNANFHHISNGNFKQPNAGLNWTSFSFSLLYFPETNQLPRFKKPPRRTREGFHPSIDIGWMFVPPQGYHKVWQTRRAFMTGLFVNSTQKLGCFNAISLGAEAYYNDFRDGASAPENNSQPALLAGIHAGHEFLLGKVIFSQQLGHYISRYPSFFHNYYHRWGLRYQLNTHWYAGFNMKVHKSTADFIDLRLLYRL